MVDFARKAAPRRRAASDDAVPEDIARALDASAEDLHQGRIEDLGEFLDGLRGKLAARKASNRTTRKS
jgi:hypothetical protein